jgi:uncharacterized protein YggE
VTDTIITVHGSHTAWHRAERATIALSVSTEGPDRSVVFERAARSAQVVRERIEGRVDRRAGPVVSWSSDRVQVWSEKPWSADGSQLDLVFHALVGFEVRFGDFGDLERFIDEVAAVDGVAVAEVGWSLTDESRIAALEEARTRAVQDAVLKAGVYARSVGLTAVRAVAVADAGMLGGAAGTAGTGDHGGLASPRMPVMSKSAAPALSLRPADIEVSATVDARFEAV